jgi:pseudo-rSAM protein
MEPDYWFTIEPYVYVNVSNNCALLYNTLDGTTLESDKVEVLNLLLEILQKENCGIVLLPNARYKQKDINGFIKELRKKYMGDVIDIALSNGKPVQMLPFFNLSNNHELYKKHNFSSYDKILKYLSEISIHVDHTTDITYLIKFLKSVPGNFTVNMVGNIGDVKNGNELLSFFDQLPFPKNIICSYTDVISLQPTFENNFSYILLVQFPVDIQQFALSRQRLLNQTLSVKYVFDVLSSGDCQQVEQLIDRFQIEKYQLNPVYTGDNIHFFEENVFLYKEDILSTSISIKDIFTNQSINIYDFGKINIMPNGDAYANVKHPPLGNIYIHSIHEIVSKEIDEGKSWLRIRNQMPCRNCVYQWLCPPPSNYEIAIDRSNLCHVKQ